MSASGSVWRRANSPGLSVALLGCLEVLDLLDRLGHPGVRIRDGAICIDDVAPRAPSHCRKRQPDRSGFEFLREMASELLVAPDSVLPDGDDAVAGIGEGELTLRHAGPFRAPLLRVQIDVRSTPDPVDIVPDQPGDAIDAAFPDEDLATVKCHLSTLYGTPLPFLRPPPYPPPQAGEGKSPTLPLDQGGKKPPHPHRPSPKREIWQGASLSCYGARRTRGRLRLGLGGRDVPLVRQGSPDRLAECLRHR